MCGGDYVIVVLKKKYNVYPYNAQFTIIVWCEGSNDMGKLMIMIMIHEMHSKGSDQTV